MIDLIKKVVEESMPLQVIPAKVLSVDKDACTCEVEPINGDADIFDVRLKAIIDDTQNGVVFYPVVGSTVLVALIENDENNAFVAMQSTFESASIIVQDGFKLELDSEGLILNEGQNGPLIVIESLKSEIDKINQFLTTIRDTFTNWVPVTQDGGAALKTAMSAALASQQTAVITAQQIGNDKIKH